MTSLLGVAIFIIILFYSIILHEIAHGWAAYRNGDNTAYNAGRLTLNPISHIDLFGSILVPIMSYLAFKIPFGWAKPVPYVPANIRHKKYAELEVASAGILTNFFLALIALALFYILRNFSLMNPNIEGVLQMTVSINIFLGLFNLLPFPPADGFSIFSELIRHGRRFFKNIGNLFNKNKVYKPDYMSDSRFQNKSFAVKHIFSNPIMMIIVIFVAVQVFSYLVPYILMFINWLFSF